MTAASDQDRAELARRASSRKTRKAAFSPDRPTKWHPTSLIHPDEGDPFTTDNCWAFIVAAIKSGAEIEVIELRHPPGKRGFVMKLPGAAGVTIYIKLQLLSDYVAGRSFHQSVTGNEED
jgi:hypothetical protein